MCWLMSPNDLSVLDKHTGMQDNTPFNPPPQSDFPFGPCQQNTGVHLLTWTAPAADPQRLQGPWTHWENTTTPEHLFFSCDNNVISRLLYCFSSRARAWRDCGCCCCCGWWWWWWSGWWSGWLDETLQAGTILRACDKSTPESMWSLQGTACALAPSPGCVEAEPGQGRERKAGREVFEEGRGGWKWERERGEGREAGLCRDSLLFAAQRCTRAPACVRHMARHAAGNPSRVHVRGKCEEAHGDKPNQNAHTHTHTHTPASVHTHMCTEAGIKCTVQMHRRRGICLSHLLHLHTSRCLQKHHVACTWDERLK